MKMILLLVVLATIAFFVFSNKQQDTAEDLLRSEVEHQVQDAFGQLGREMSSSGSKNAKKPKPKNTPQIYSDAVCGDARSRCQQIMNLKRNSPPGTKFDTSFGEGVAWCEHVLQECESRRL